MALPIGPAVTFLFTDIEGSTRSSGRSGPRRGRASSRATTRSSGAAIEANDGVVVKTEGDAFFAAFAAPGSAVAAAVAAQRAVADESWRRRARAPRPDGPPPRRGPAALGTQRGRARGLRRHRRELRGPDRGGGERRPDRRVERARERAGVGLRRTRLGDACSSTTACARSRTSRTRCRLYRLVVPGAADDPRPLRTLEAAVEPAGRGHRASSAATTRSSAVRDELRGEPDRHADRTRRQRQDAARARRSRATSARAFPHGTWFVDLAAIRDPALLEPTIAATMGVRESAEQPVEDALRAHLRDRTALLVLDNLEQLLPDGAEIVARLVRDAARAAPARHEPRAAADQRGARSSRPAARRRRRRRAVRGSRARAPPGPRPRRRRDGRHPRDPRAARRPAAGDRARRGPDPPAVARADPRPPRAQPRPRRRRRATCPSGSGPCAARSPGATTCSRRPSGACSRRLGVFAGGWTADDGRTGRRTPTGDLGIDLVDGLESLADKSLIRVEPAPSGAPAADAETRFSLHPLLREYALERLAERGELEADGGAVRRGMCVGIADEAGAAILGQSGEATMRRLDREDRNLRAAIDWSLAHDEPDIGLRIIGATWRWFQQRGRLREGRGLLGAAARRARRTTRACGSSAWPPRAASPTGWTTSPPRAPPTRSDSRSPTATGDPILMADAHYDLGFLSMVAQRQADLLREHEQLALDLYLAAGHEDGAIRARQALVLAVFLARRLRRGARPRVAEPRGVQPDAARSSRSPTA